MDGIGTIGAINGQGGTGGIGEDASIVYHTER